MTVGECWCCGLGNVSGSLCGHCASAGCNRFTDYCEAAGEENPDLSNSERA